MKNFFSTATLTTVFLGLTLTTLPASSAESPVDCGGPTPGIDCSSAAAVNTSHSNIKNLKSSPALEKDSISTEVAAPRDAASGLPTGNREFKEAMITEKVDKGAHMPSSTETNATTEMEQPRDPATGLSTGRTTSGGLAECQATCRENNQANPDALAACLRECTAVGPASSK